VKKEIFVIGIIFLVVVISGCVQQPLQNEKIILPQKQSEQQGTQEKQPPLECVDKKATDLNLPESCKNWFSVERMMSVQQDPSEKEMSVKALQSSYKTITAKPSGWFKTGQDADIMLSGAGFNDAGGPLQFNHPGGFPLTVGILSWQTGLTTES